MGINSFSLAGFGTLAACILENIFPGSVSIDSGSRYLGSAKSWLKRMTKFTEANTP
jgi:hypothetical protein